eukprot:TRINITY_DN4958_c0_g1_i1.p1 TRINITY_DN4958_c0_g1~~TRINITY_DN4958_c0_g1_i1.p1  ORF type:complete len:248 (+),score=36.57 TRINITY_DN4958_c0_g1_i1:68-745(+)
MAPQRRDARRALAAAGLVACAYLASSDAFVSPNVVTAPRSSLVQMQAGGEYTGFVPDMQRRQLMNFVAIAASAVPALTLLGAFAWYFFPQSSGGAGGATPIGDENGAPIKLTDWVAGHKDDDRQLVLGLKGDPYYLISTPDNIKDFAILSVCTHLGCVVPWDKSRNKFCCPCHGSQYDNNGKVVRGPAPLSLALAHTSVDDDGKINVSPWTEQDFRTGLQPWWSA